jgi:hypothetical protein
VDAPARDHQWREQERDKKIQSPVAWNINGDSGDLFVTRTVLST